MLLSRWSQKFYASTRGRIITLLRRASLTVDQLAGRLGLTDNAVRAHLATLERDGLVEQHVVKRGGVGKPAFTYQVTAEAEPLFSRAYIPVLAKLLDVLSEQMPRDEFDALMRSVGKRLAAERGTLSGTPRERLEAAVTFLNELGGVAEVEERDDALAVRGFSCPLGAAVHGHPEVCRAVESLLSEATGLPVRERCDRAERARCCFEIGPRDAASR
jgi:predicted ArsR family transcriptional regulator